MISKIMRETSVKSLLQSIDRMQKALDVADTVVIGAGAGLSVSAGFVYKGERFARYFSDFEAEYGFHDMYTGGFWPYQTPEEYWGYWSRYIYVNRYKNPPKPVYTQLLELAKEKDYFVLTTNVDHCFQKAGFDKKRLFYTQGDYGLFQCSGPCHKETYENIEMVRNMLQAQGFAFGPDGELLPPEDNSLSMQIPSHLVPHCPVCGRPMTMNLRADDSFVEDEGWHLAAERYENFLRTRRGGRTVYLELGVGYNTPVIIKYPFWRMTAQNPDATYVCINKGAAGCPPEIRKRSVCLDEDIGEVLAELLK